MTNKERIAKIDGEVANSESGSHLRTYMPTVDARFMLDRIVNYERLAEAVARRRKLALARDGGDDLALAFVSEGEALAKCELENTV